jgi:hypothetical protein
VTAGRARRVGGGRTPGGGGCGRVGSPRLGDGSSCRSLGYSGAGWRGSGRSPPGSESASLCAVARRPGQGQHGVRLGQWEREGVQDCGSGSVLKFACHGRASQRAVRARARARSRASVRACVRVSICEPASSPPTHIYPFSLSPACLPASLPPSPCLPVSLPPCLSLVSVRVSVSRVR